MHDHLVLGSKLILLTIYFWEEEQFSVSL